LETFAKPRDTNPTDHLKPSLARAFYWSTAMATKIKITGLEALAIRKKLSLNQSDFWTPFGVTQSGGSRYESGRNIPRPVQILLAAKYGKAAAKREALAVVGVEAV